ILRRPPPAPFGALLLHHRLGERTDERVIGIQRERRRENARIWPDARREVEWRDRGIRDDRTAPLDANERPRRFHQSTCRLDLPTTRQYFREPRPILERE